VSTIEQIIDLPHVSFAALIRDIQMKYHDTLSAIFTFPTADFGALSLPFFQKSAIFDYFFGYSDLGLD
jgi:hypothetical protein